MRHRRNPPYRALAIATLAPAFLLAACSSERYTPPPLAFSGDSTQLKTTIVVPTLDTPFAPDKNAIWCAAFELAWKEFGKTTGTPLIVAGAEAMCERLNRSVITPDDVPEGAVFADAGSAEMLLSKFEAVRARFPDIDAPSFQGGGSPVAFAALQVHIPFTPPYQQNEKPLQFTDSAGGKHPLKSFGLPPEGDQPADIAANVELLFTRPDDEELKVSVFAVDLNKNGDTQVIVASMPCGDTLTATLEALLQNQAAFPAAKHPFMDIVVVPEVSFQIRQHFALLEKDVFQEASESIRFTLDSSGVKLASDAPMHPMSLPYIYAADGPFLIVLKKRGAINPYFVMWVANAELLNPF